MGCLKPRPFSQFLSSMATPFYNIRTVHGSSEATNGTAPCQHSTAKALVAKRSWRLANRSLVACFIAVMEVSKPFIGGMFYSGDGG